MLDVGACPIWCFPIPFLEPVPFSGMVNGMSRSWNSGIVILATALVFGAASCSKSPDEQASIGAQTNAPIVIEPNVSVGKIRAGMTTQQVIAELGQPQRRTANALEYTRMGLAVMPDTNGIVQVVMCGDVTGINGPLVKAFTGRTTEGIGMKSTREEVIKAFGEPSGTERFPGAIESLNYDRLGLTLTLESGKVHHLIVRIRSEPDRTIKLEPAPGSPPK